MAKRSSSRLGQRRLGVVFDEQRRILEETRGLGDSYSSFLADWKEYAKNQKASRKTPRSREYVAHRTSLQE